jgi:hypothetical protein
MLVLLSPAEIKAQERKQSVVTIQVYSVGGNGVYVLDTNIPFTIQTIDNELNITEQKFEPTRNNRINALLELRKTMDVWINLGYKVHTFNEMTEPTSVFRIYSVLLVKDEE